MSIINASNNLIQSINSLSDKIFKYNFELNLNEL